MLRRWKTALVAAAVVGGLAAGPTPASAAERTALPQTSLFTTNCTAPANHQCWEIPPPETFGGHATIWDDPHYVMRSNSPTLSRLVLFLHGNEANASAFYNSGAVTAESNIMASAAKSGYYAIALTHRNSPNVRVVCGSDMSCHLPTRRTLIEGVGQPGDHTSVDDMEVDDGIKPRLIHLLTHLRDTVDTPGGWGQFLFPSGCTGVLLSNPNPCTIAWNKIVVAGHSQGGGHAAVLGHDLALPGVVTLAAPTDYHTNSGVTSHPDYTLGAGLATAPGGGRWKGLVHEDDEFRPAATFHWGPTRLGEAPGLYGFESTTTNGACVGGLNPHNCVITWNGFYADWLRFWWNRADAVLEPTTDSPAHAILDGTPHLFARKSGGAGGQIHYSIWDGTGWRPYQPIANTGLPSGVTPAAGANAPSVATFGGRDFVAVRGSDNKLYVTSRLTGTTTFGNWSEIAMGGLTRENPALVAFNGKLYAFITRNDDNSLWYNTTTGTAWSTPTEVTELGTALGGAAAVVDATHLRVYARRLDTDGKQRVFGVATSDGSTFNGPGTALMTAEVSGAPSLATDGSRIWMAVRTSDGHLGWAVRTSAGSWLGPYRLSTDTVAGDTSPSLYREPDGLLTVYSRSTSNTVQAHSHRLTGPANLASGRVSVNAGGTTVGTFLADDNYSGGATFSTAAAIDTSGAGGAAPSAVYQTERYGTFTYTVGGLTPNAGYLVRLHEAEIFHNSAGARQFDVAANGAPKLTDFDIYAATGGKNKAVVVDFYAVADGSGRLALQFTPGSADQPKVSGIEIYQGAPGPSAVNAGGLAVDWFVADTGFSGSSSTFSTPDSVDVSAPGTGPANIYKSERFGTPSFSYTVGGLTANGSYLVRLHEAEIFHTSAGARRFNVAANGVSKLTNFDIYAAAGGHDKAVVVDFHATANGAGQIVLDFTSGSAGQPKVSAIEILRQ